MVQSKLEHRLQDSTILKLYGLKHHDFIIL